MKGKASSLEGIAGIVLAGGRSSRMGVDKAMLDYKGRTMLDHMRAVLLAAGIKDVFISGSYENYPCIADNGTFSGPARAISHVMQYLHEYKGFLFVPVDMPFLDESALRALLSRSSGGYYRHSPLPVFIPKMNRISKAVSVQSLLDDLDIDPIEIPADRVAILINTNTPEDWKKVQVAS